jgi:hypothetical protein
MATSFLRTWLDRLLRLTLPLVMLSGGCSSPGAEDYISAARQHARLAEEHNSRARQHQDAAQVLARQGDEVGANIIEGAATADEWAARREILHCHKDVWISEWIKAIRGRPAVACSSVPASPNGFPSTPGRRPCSLRGEAQIDNCDPSA